MNRATSKSSDAWSTSQLDAQRREGEEQLRSIAAREILEDAIESLPEGFALWDADDRLILCNARFREFNALSADALVPGIPWLDFIRTGAERGQYVDAIGRMEQWLEECRHSLSPGAEFQQSDGRWYHAFLQSTRQSGVAVAGGGERRAYQGQGG